MADYCGMVKVIFKLNFTICVSSYLILCTVCDLILGQCDCTFYAIYWSIVVGFALLCLASSVHFIADQLI